MTAHSLDIVAGRGICIYIKVPDMFFFLRDFVSIKLMSRLGRDMVYTVPLTKIILNTVLCYVFLFLRCCTVIFAGECHS
jgi:hypothetical protein